MILFFVTLGPILGHLLDVVEMGLLHNLHRFLCLKDSVGHGFVYDLALVDVALELGVVDMLWHLS